MMDSRLVTTMGIIIMFLLILLISCQLFAKTNAYDVIFHPNQEADIDSYRFYFWEGSDTTDVDSSDYVFYKQVSHDSLVAIYGGQPTDTLRLVDFYPSEENGEYLGVAAQAVNIWGVASKFAFGKFYQKANKTKPSAMRGLGIRR